MKNKRTTSSGPTNIIWSVLTAPGTTATLACVIALFATTAVFVPQGAPTEELLRRFGSDWAALISDTGLARVASHPLLWTAVLALVLNLIAMAIERYYDAVRLGEPWWFLGNRSASNSVERTLDYRVERATAGDALRKCGAATVSSASPHRVTGSSPQIMPVLLLTLAGLILVGGSLFESRHDEVGYLQLLAGRTSNNGLSYRIRRGTTDVPANFDPSFRCSLPKSEPPHEVTCTTGPLRAHTRAYEVAFNRPARLDGMMLTLRRIERAPNGRTALLEVQVPGRPSELIVARYQKRFKLADRTWLVAALDLRGRHGLGPVATIIPADKKGRFLRAEMLSVYQGKPASWSENSTGVTFRWVPDVRLHFTVASSPVRSALWAGLGCFALALLLLALLPIWSAELILDEGGGRLAVRSLGRRDVAATVAARISDALAQTRTRTERGAA